jgi:2-haloacid dehalogenase
VPIAFDAFGTLFDLEALREPAGDELYDAFYARLQPWTWLATAAGAYRPLPQLAEQALRAAAKQVGQDPERAAQLVGELTTLPLFPEARDALDALREKHALAVLSNGTRDGLEELLGNAGIRDRFEHVIAADSIKRYKPAHELYQLAPRAFAAAPHEVVLVSGNDWDAAGAKLAGLSSAWVSRGRPLAPVLGVEPDHVVKDLSELVFALDG